MKTCHLLNEEEVKELIPHGGNLNFRSYKVGKDNDYMKQAFGNGLVRDLDVVGKPQSLKSWHNLMNSSAAYSYNDFSADEVYSWLSQNINAVDQLKFIPAREGSIALYIMGPIEHLKQVEKVIGDHMPDQGYPSTLEIVHMKDIMPKMPAVVQWPRGDINWDKQHAPSSLNPGWKTIGKNLLLLRLWWD